MDDDGDGAIDCADSTCAVVGACAAPDTGGLDAGPTPLDAPFVFADVPGQDAGPPTVCGPLDVVFVLDVSTSIESSLDALRNGIGDVWTAATALSPDPRSSMVMFVDDALAVNGCTPFASVDELRGAFDTWRRFCAKQNRRDTGSFASRRFCFAERSWVGATNRLRRAGGGSASDPPEGRATHDSASRRACVATRAL